jgi:hypothetical protein
MKSLSRLNNPELQAERVLMMKLGIQPDAVQTDRGSFSQLREILDGPVSADMQEALDALFPEDGYNGPTLLDMES